MQWGIGPRCGRQAVKSKIVNQHRTWAHNARGRAAGPELLSYLSNNNFGSRFSRHVSWRHSHLNQAAGSGPSQARSIQPAAALGSGTCGPLPLHLLLAGSGSSTCDFVGELVLTACAHASN